MIYLNSLIRIFYSKSKSTNLKTICYISEAGEHLTKLEIQAILDFSVFHNKKNNISGFLIYSLGKFFQIIEGEEDLIDTIYRKIIVDSRHSDINQLFNFTISKSYFSSYRSSFTRANKSEEISSLNNYLQMTSNHPKASSLKNILSTLQHTL